MPRRYDINARVGEGHATPTRSEGDTVEKRVGRVDSLTVYEVTDDELRQLEDGSPDSLMLTMAIFCFGAGISLLPTFVAATYSSLVTKAVFACITAVAFLAGVLLIALWLSFRRSRTATFDKIRKRGSESQTAGIRVANQPRVAAPTAASTESALGLEEADAEAEAEAARKPK
jgi:hypothetical protein